MISARDRVAAADRVDRLLARLHADWIDGVEELVGVLRGVDLLAADLHAERVAGHLVEERDLRLGVVALDREPQQRADQAAVEQQQRHQQRRAAQDLQVLEQQPAHSVALGVQEAHERGLEVAGAVPDRRLAARPACRRTAARRRRAPARGRRSARPRRRRASRTRPSCRRARGSPMNSHSRSRWRGSSAEDGSSSSSTGGSASRPTAMLTRWRLPPDSLPSSSRARSRRPVWSSMRSTAASGSATRSSRANSRRFSATESFE